MRHITIQEISSRFPEYHNFLIKTGKNNNNNIFFIDQRTEVMSTPVIYLMWCGELGALYYCQGVLCVHIVPNIGLKDEALSIARNVVTGKHPYLASALDTLEIICGVKSSNALF